LLQQQQQQQQKQLGCFDLVAANVVLPYLVFKLAMNIIPE